MNRYTQITPSQFQPLSLQEIMLVPTLKRQHHDAAIAAMEQLRDLQADPHDLHREEALRLKSDFENKLNADIELLNSQGYNSSVVSNLSRLNKEYRDLTGPMGRIGQINAANKAYQQRFKDYMENAQKNGQSREVALWNWENTHKPTWSGYDDDRNITQIGEYGAPVRQDFMKYVSDLANKVGFDEEGTAWATSNLSYDNDQNRFVVNSSGSNVTKDNLDRLQNLANLLTSELQDPRSKYRLDMDFNREDPNKMLYRAKQLLDSRREYSSVDKRNTSKNNVDWAKSSEDPSGFDFLMNEEVYTPNEFASRGYTDNVNRYRDLTSGRTLTIEEEKELVNLEEFLENVDGKLAEDKNYQRLKTERDANINTLGLNENVAKWLKSQLNDNITSQGLLSNTFTPDKLLETLYGSATNPYSHSDYQDGDYQKIRNFLRSDETQKKMEKIASEYNKQGHLKTTGYQILPTTTKEKSEWAIVNHNFEKALKANPENLLNYLNIESVNMQDGLRRESSELDETDLKRIKELFNKSKDGSLEVVSISTKGKSGKPEYVLKINTTEDNKVDLNRNLRSEEGQGTLGGGVPVYLKVSYDHTKGDVLETANGYLQRYLIGKGRKDPDTKRHHGTELALDIEANRVKSRLNKQYSESGVTWGSLITEDTDFREIDPFVSKELSKRLKKYYKNENPSDSEIKEAIQNFLKNNQNRLIYLK